MPTPGTIEVELKLNLEGHWPRSTYRQHCATLGIEYREEDYLQWRAVGERLTGEPCFETQVQRTSAAFEALGLSMARAAEHMRRFLQPVEPS